MPLRLVEGGVGLLEEKIFRTPVQLSESKPVNSHFEEKICQSGAMLTLRNK